MDILAGRRAMVWLDVEDDVQKNLGQTLIDIINAYGKVISDSGLNFGVYTGLSFYNSYIKPYADQLAHPFWTARYPSSAAVTIVDDPADSKRPEISHELYGWQWSDKGQVSGISVNEDLDELYVAVETVNVVEAAGKSEESQSADTLAHFVGGDVTVSSYYASSTDDVSKAIIKNNSGTITRIKAGTRNPYCYGKSGVAIGWCNDGDIRSGSDSAFADDSSASTATSYTVRSGDTLSKIAKAYGTTVDAIMALNTDKIKDKDKIYVGWVIRAK